MSPREPDPLSESAPLGVSWVRKRDDRIVAFDAGKVASSIFAAHEQVDQEDPAFAAQELSQAVLHFLGESFSGQIPTTSDLAESVAKTLRELGQGPTAQAYVDYGRRRQQMRDKISLITREEPLVEPAPQGPLVWNKSELIGRLENEVDVDPDRARELATSIEHRLLALGLTRISRELIDELVFCELYGHGLERRWQRRQAISLAGSSLSTHCADPSLTPNRLIEWAGREVLRQFARREVFSRDVTALLEEGSLSLLADSTPVQWASIALHPVRASARDGALIDRWWSAVEDAKRWSAAWISFDSLDAWLALEADSDLDPARTAREFADRLASAAQESSHHWIVNLFGQVPTDWRSSESSDGLFSTGGREALEHWARSFVEAFGSSVVDGAAWLSRGRIDLHLDGMDSAAALERRIAPWINSALKGVPVGWAFDRPEWSAGEGLFGPSGQAEAAVEFVGVNLPFIFDRVGEQLDESLFLKRVDLACDAAVRLGMQKREYLRERTSAGGPWYGGAVVVCPLHLEAVIEQSIRGGLVAEEAGLDLAERILRRMSLRLQRESKPYRLRCYLDAPPGGATLERAMPASRAKRTAGQALVSAGRWHHAMAGGSTRLRLTQVTTPAELTRVVIQSARESRMCRLIVTPPPPDRQPKLFDT